MTIEEDFAFLRARGYEVGDSFVSPEGKMHTWVAGRACAFEHVQILVAIENIKSKVRTIDSPAPTDLVALCRQVAASGDVDSETSAKARAFETEWRLLIQRSTPPSPLLRDQQAFDAEGAALAGRIVTFLTRELPNLSALTRAYSG
jgi:hypothetical protein